MSKKPIKKKTFDLSLFKESSGFSSLNVKDKELEIIPFSDAFKEVVKIPGIYKGYTTLFRGFSNTGKSTAIYEIVKAAQRLGDTLPVIIDTENNWDWNHARNIGVEFDEVRDEKTGEVVDYSGHFIYINNDILLNKYGKIDHEKGKEKKDGRDEAVIEDVAMLIDDLLEEQKKGALDIDLCFLWDSIGSVDCMRCVNSKTRNNMWNAGALSTSFNSILNHKIPASRKEGKAHTNTLIGVQKVWLDNENKVIKHKGGEAFFYGARLIIHLGGIITHGTSALVATANSKTYRYGTEAKIKVVKNQITGIEYEGVIASTMHGYINPEKINDYVNKHRNFFKEVLSADTFKLEKTGPDDLDVESMKEGN